jgi:hypothetical protein
MKEPLVLAAIVLGFTVRASTPRSFAARFSAGSPIC